MTPPPPGYPSAAPGPPNHEQPSTPPTGTSTDNNGNDKGGPWALPLPPPPGRSAAPLPVRIVRLQEKKGLLTVATGIMLFVFAMTAATAIGTSNRLPDYDSEDGGTIPVSYFGAWSKFGSPLGRHKRDNGRHHPEYEPGTEPETTYVEKGALLVHFWMFALSDFPSALVAIFVLANIAIFRRALFYFIALIVLAVCFVVFLIAPLVITVTTLNTKLGRSTIKEMLDFDCCKPGEGLDVCTGPYADRYKLKVDACKAPQSREITAIVLMWLFWLITAVLRAGYLFMVFQAWKKQKNNDGDSIR